MTRLLFLPNEHTLFFLEVKSPVRQILEGIRAISSLHQISGTEWLTADPILDGEFKLHANPQDDLIVITPQHPENSGSIQLTERQLQVVQCLAEGLTTEQIARRLQLHPRTVGMHIAALKERAGAATRAEVMHRLAVCGYCSNPKKHARR